MRSVRGCDLWFNGIFNDYQHPTVIENARRKRARGETGLFEYAGTLEEGGDLQTIQVCAPHHKLNFSLSII